MPHLDRIVFKHKSSPEALRALRYAFFTMAEVYLNEEIRALTKDERKMYEDIADLKICVLQLIEVKGSPSYPILKDQDEREKNSPEKLRKLL